MRVFLLIVFSWWYVFSQPALGVFADANSFKSAYLMGDPFEATVYLQNTGDRPYTGDVDVEVRVDYTLTGNFPRLLGIISFNNVTLYPKQYIPVDLSVFSISDVIFHEGDDIVIIWPKLPPNSNVKVSDTLYQIINVTIKADYTLVKKDAELNYIKVYPNPTSGELFVTGVEDIKRLTLFSANGAKVKEQIVLNSIPEGLYYIWVETKDNKQKAIVIIKD